MFKNEVWISGKYYWIRKHGNDFQVCKQDNEFSNTFTVEHTGSFLSCGAYLEESRNENPINPINRRN